MRLATRIAFLVGLAITLVACSAVRLGYLNADWYATRQADRYLDLDREQRTWLRDRMAIHQDWHRRDELPKIDHMIASMQSRLDGGLETQDVEWFIAESSARWSALVTRVLPDMVMLLVRLDDAQVDHLEQRLLENLERPPGSDRHARVITRIERFTGRLDRAQRARVKVLLDEDAVDDGWSERRHARIREFIASLRDSTDADTLQRMLESWWSAAENPDPDALEGRIRFTMAVYGLLEPRQRAHVVRQLDGYRRDVSALILEAAE